MTLKLNGKEATAALTVVGLFGTSPAESSGMANGLVKELNLNESMKLTAAAM